MKKLNFADIQSVSGGVKFSEIMLEMSLAGLGANLGIGLAYIKPLMDYSTTGGHVPNALILGAGVFFGAGIGVAVSQIINFKLQLADSF